MPEDNRPAPIKNAAPGVMEATDLLRRQAFKMRSEKMTYQTIAKALGVSRGHAFRLANDGWEKLAEDDKEARLNQRAIEIERLEELIAAIWDVAVGDVAHLDGEAQAAAIENQLKAQVIVNRHLQTIARLLGLYAPTKIEITGGKSNLISIDELRERTKEAKEHRERIARGGVN